MEYMDKNYMAGLIEGEGCFGVYLYGQYYRPTFEIDLRADDEVILRELLNALHISRPLPIRIQQRNTSPNAMPMAKLRLGHSNDLLKLITFLDENPFIGKKRLQYNIWKEATLLYRKHKHTTRGNLEKRAQINEQMQLYCIKLKELKQYKGEK